MTQESVQKLRTELFNALQPVEEKHRAVIKSSIKYCVVIDNAGKLITADWLNDYPEILTEIRDIYNRVLEQIIQVS